MKTLDIAEATRPLAEYANIVTNEPVIVMSHGKALMALIDLNHIDLESLSLSPDFMEIINRSRERHARACLMNCKLQNLRNMKPDPLTVVPR